MMPEKNQVKDATTLKKEKNTKIRASLHICILCHYLKTDVVNDPVSRTINWPSIKNEETLSLLVPRLKNDLL